MAGKRKKNRMMIKLGNKESKHIYYTYKNKNNTMNKLSIRKFAPDLNKVIVFTEMK